MELEKELSDEDDESSDVVLVKHRTAKQLVEYFKHTDVLNGNDGHRERNAEVPTGIEGALACYKELYRGRLEAARHLCLHRLFKAIESC